MYRFQFTPNPGFPALCAQGRTLIPPHGKDAAPFTVLNASTSGLLDDTTQTAVLTFQITRFLWGTNFNSLFPVHAVGALALFIFWLPEEELAARIEVCAALFLTLIGRSLQ